MYSHSPLELQWGMEAEAWDADCTYFDRIPEPVEIVG